MYHEEAEKQIKLTQNISIEEQSHYVIQTLYHLIHKEGHIPSRDIFEPYQTQLNNQVQAFTLVNCLGHALNLSNQELNDFLIKPYRIYGHFPQIRKACKAVGAQQTFDFLNEIGLKVEPCAPDEKIKNSKSWKIAFYHDKITKDWHYFLEEMPNCWTCKMGFSPSVQLVIGEFPGETFQGITDPMQNNYEFYGTYKITNPNANGNYCYAKKLHKFCIPNQSKNHIKHYVIEGGLEANLDYLQYK